MYKGKHVMLDVIVEDKESLTVPQIGVSFLEDIVQTIDMTMILPPITVKFPHSICELKRVLEKLEAEGLSDSKTAQGIKKDLQLRKEESYGYSSFVMIAESHITIHTFPEYNYFSFDCYSCKWFDDEKINDLMSKYFVVKNIIKQIASRSIPTFTLEKENA
jgi:S-adenosylmethionine/arginine decarboxylase-like enzyme